MEKSTEKETEMDKLKMIIWGKFTDDFAYQHKEICVFVVFFFLLGSRFLKDSHLFIYLDF